MSGEHTDADYVQSVVGSALVEGLTAVVKAQPEDPVDYLGRFLVHYADHLEKQLKAEAAAAEAQALAKAQADAAAAKETSAKEAAASGPEARAAGGEAAIKALLEGAAEVDAGVLGGVVQHLAECLNATGVYIAEKVPGAAGGEGEAAAGSLRYIATSKGQEFLREVILPEPPAEGAAPNSGVTFKAWVMPPAPEPAEPVEVPEGEAPPPPPPPPELPVITVQDVLRSAEITFHRLPKPGAFVAAPLQYGSLLHDNALPKDVPVTTGEDGAMVVPPGVPLSRSLALCADTLGQNRSWSAADIALIKRVAGYLKAALERTEAALYAQEYIAANTVAEAPAPSEDAASAAQAAEAETAAELEAAGEGANEETKALIKSKGGYRAALHELDSRLSLIAEIQRRRIVPKEPCVKVLQAIWYLLGYRKEELGDSTGPQKGVFKWDTAKGHLGKDFVARLKAYDPTAVATVTAYQKVDAIKGLLEGLSKEELNKSSIAFGVMFDFATAAVAVREAAVAKRAKDKEAEDAAKAAEEAAKAAAAEAAEAPAE